MAERACTGESVPALSHQSLVPVYCRTIVFYKCRIIVFYKCRIIVFYKCRIIVFYKCRIIVFYKCRTIVFYKCKPTRCMLFICNVKGGGGLCFALFSLLVLMLVPS